MICSSASAEREIVSDEPPLARRQLGSLQQFRHAHHAVHGRADLMAHASQEFALGVAGGLGRVLGAVGLIDRLLQFPIGIAELHPQAVIALSRRLLHGVRQIRREA